MIELIDTEEKIEGFYSIIGPELEALPKGCLVTITPAEIRIHKHGIKRDTD